jgi:predicted  nucleic acid-binding Zn-ribbon protein
LTETTGILLRHLTFTGQHAEPAELIFPRALYVLYGASNTGKSFALKSLDFMLGSSTPLPSTTERQPYDRAWLSVDLPKYGTATLRRALAGGPFELMPGDVLVTNGRNAPHLSARHDPSSTNNLSQFLLEEIGLGGRQIVTDANGKKRSLSFRDLFRYCIVDETAIQSEISPATSGQFPLSTAERSIFRLLITGDDDRAVVPVIDPRTFRVATTGKLEVLDEMITAIDEDLTADYQDPEHLPDQEKRLEETWQTAQSELEAARGSIRELLSSKWDTANRITRLKGRREEIEINVGRFEQLREVYQSDIQRLEAIEEAGFLLSLGGDRDCPLCGASPEHQKFVHGIDEIERARSAAGAEIAKIRQQNSELSATLDDLDHEAAEIEDQIDLAEAKLTDLEEQLQDLAPTANTARQRVNDILSVRDQVRRGLSLIQQRADLVGRREQLTNLRPPTKAEKPRLEVPSSALHEFAQTVSAILKEWHFPGDRHVSFDEVSFDLRIDGKARRDNGKGVRAVTHAAFKVGLLLFCRERNLPHPGFLVLDTPLLTYRDPIRSKEGALSDDEQALSNTSLKDFFFEHLSRNSDKGQFVVIENVDLPPGIEGLAHVETFTGDPASGRSGLLYPPRAQ